MKKYLNYVSVLTIIALGFGNITAQESIKPPVAKKVYHADTTHGDIRVDHYNWLHDRESQEVRDHLEDENAYTQSMLKHTKKLQKGLYKEIRGRIKETDLSVPYFKNGYWYYYKFEKGKDYEVACRKKGSLDAEEEVLMDVNEMAKGKEYYEVYGFDISPDNKIMAFYPDETGNFITPALFKNLETGEMLEDRIEAVQSLAWCNDNKTLIYTTADEVTNRSNEAKKHVLGANSSKDEVIFNEDNELFNVYVWSTKSSEYIVMGSYSSESSESWVLDANKPGSEFEMVHPREEKHTYEVYHYQDKFYILTDKDAPNYKLVETSTEDYKIDNWKELIPHREDVLLNGIEIFKDYLVVSEQKNALKLFKVINWESNEEYYVEFDDEIYAAFWGSNEGFDTDLLRFNYQSMNTPNTVYDYNLKTKEKTLLKQSEVVGGHNPDDYIVKREWATGRDGEKIPISLIYHKDTKIDGSAPLYLSGYGSYGAKQSATFSSTRLTLLNRGFVVAKAHVRGGSDMGKHWYLNGKKDKKKNTFYDFIDCTEHLIAEGYTSKGEVSAYGGSAGGLLMGAIANMRPDLYKNIMLDVPFVDVINTMLDPTIPLTTQEYEEWGNPNVKADYDYIKSYSPYDNVEAKDYPNMLFMTGYTDEQVGFWEPAKMVAKLRETKTDDNLLLFDTNMSGGHGGSSGLYSWIDEITLMYAFIFDSYGITE